jgi:hypothetical protein
MRFENGTFFLAGRLAISSKACCSSRNVLNAATGRLAQRGAYYRLFR